MSQNLRTTTTMRLGSLLLSTALAACTVGPDYSTPKTEWRRSMSIERRCRIRLRCRGIKLIPTATGSAPAGRCRVAARYHGGEEPCRLTLETAPPHRSASERALGERCYVPPADPNGSNPVHCA